MTILTSKRLTRFSASLLLLSLFALCSYGQTTAFTYQGLVKDGASAANGNYDFEFRLFSAVSGGSQAGSTLTRTGVGVENGIFAVELDFGDLPFPGADRFLEMRIRPAGGGAFILLTPRQKVGGSPYSTLTATALNAQQLGGLTANAFIQTGATSINAGSHFNIGGNRVFATPANENTFVGVSSGTSNTSSTGNTFVGFGSGQDNSTGGQNTAVGARAGQNLTGFANAFFGYNAGNAVTSQGGNAFFGSYAGYSNTAADNSFFGTAAGGGNTTGTQNSFFGKHAGLENVSANENSYFGFEAGRNATSSFNSFFGSRAGQAVSSGASNSFFGTAAGVATTSGGDNAFFGVNTGGLNVTGSGNSYFGRRAGRDSTGSNNTAVGIDAGRDNLTGSNNTFIGAGADATVANLTFAAAIGAGATVSNSNEIALGRSIDTVRVGGLRAGHAKVLGYLDVDDIIDGYQLILQNSLLVEDGTPACITQFNGADFPPGYPMGQFFMFTRCGSSLKLKSDVATRTEGISTLQKLRPVTFNWRSSGRTAIGLIAEEVNDVDPLLATREKDGTVFGVDFNAVTAVLVRAFQEQQTQLEELKQLVGKQSALLREQQRQIGRQTTAIQKLRSWRKKK